MTIAQSFVTLSTSKHTLPKNLILTPAIIIDELDSITGWAAANGSRALNNSEFISGTGSVKLTGNGASGSTHIEKAGSWNLAGQSDNIAFWVYIHSALSTIINLVIYLSNDAGFTNFFFSQIGTPLHTGWNVINPVNWTIGGGAPSWNSPMVRVRLRTSCNVGDVPITSWDRLEYGATRKPAVLISFDDGISSAYTQGFKIMHDRGLVGTMYMIGNILGSSGVSLVQLREMERAGWAIANHSYTHTDFTTLNQANVQAELTNCKNALDAAGFTENSSHVGYPFGTRNATTMLAMQAVNMMTGRMVDGNPMAIEYTDPYNISCKKHDNTVSLATSKGYIDNAIALNKVVGLLFHNILQSAGADTWSVSDFTALMDYILSKNIQCLNVGEFYKLRSNYTSVNHK